MYFEHDLSVKIMDNILAKSKEWDWFIDYIETQDIDFSISSFDDFFRLKIEIDDLFLYFIKIREYYSGDLEIHTQWLLDLDVLSLYYTGYLTLPEVCCTNDFFKIFKLLILCGKIYSVGKSKKHIIYQDIFMLRNIFQLEDLKEFYDEKDTIYQLIADVSINLDEPKNRFISNINRVYYQDDAFLTENKSTFLNANCFSYHYVSIPKYKTWQERYLFEMVSTKYENGNLMQTVTYRNGNGFPDFSLWTDIAIASMKDYFDNQIANFIIESVDFAVHNTTPSQSTIETHFKLLLDYYQKVDSEKELEYYCSSLEFIISFFKDNNTLQLISPNCYVLLSKAIELVKIDDVLLFFDKNGILRNKKKKEKINNIINRKLQMVDSIRDHISFSEYISDNDIIYRIDKAIADKLSDVFDDIVSQCDGIIIASLFLEYFKFLTKIINNRGIVSIEVQYEIIRIRCLWSDEYYQKAKAGLQTFTHSFSVDQEKINQANNAIYQYPIAFALSVFGFKENDLISALQNISNTPMLTLCSQIIISEDFPKEYELNMDDNHIVDNIFRQVIHKTVKENSYKLLNSFSPEQYLRELYKTIIRFINAEVFFFEDHEKIYNTIKQDFSEYNLIEFSSIPCLAHLSQLFPILENRIRDYGEVCGIVPVNLKSGYWDKLKSPTSILTEIIKNIYEMTGSLVNAADFFFIYFCMYGENGLNIRNECVHGKNYIKSNEITYAFKITLLCIHMIDNRFKMFRKDI